MTTKTAISAAEATDLHTRFTALCFLMFAALYASEIASSVVEGPAADILRYAEGGLFILVVLFAAPLIRWKWRMLPKLSESERRQYFSSDSFSVSVIKQARNVSWGTTFFTLVLIDDSTAYPPGLFVKIVLVVLLGSFSLSYFALGSFVRTRNGVDDCG